MKTVDSENRILYHLCEREKRDFLEENCSLFRLSYSSHQGIVVCLQQTEFLHQHLTFVCVCVCVCVHARACAQLCPTLCNSMDYSPPGSSVHGIIWGSNLHLLQLLHWPPVPPETQRLTLRKLPFSSLLFIGLVGKFVRVFP